MDFALLAVLESSKSSGTDTKGLSDQDGGSGVFLLEGRVVLGQELSKYISVSMKEVWLVKGKYMCIYIASDPCFFFQGWPVYRSTLQSRNAEKRRTYLNGTEASPVCEKWNLSSLRALGKTNLADMVVVWLCV